MASMAENGVIIEMASGGGAISEAKKMAKMQTERENVSMKVSKRIEAAIETAYQRKNNESGISEMAKWRNNGGAIRNIGEISGHRGQAAGGGSGGGGGESAMAGDRNGVGRRRGVIVKNGG